jgi:hypothetical protein
MMPACIFSSPVFARSHPGIDFTGFPMAFFGEASGGTICDWARQAPGFDSRICRGINRRLFKRGFE